jgi:alpha-D-ribose 1-methylphosphonate 5-triphosphate synthase subunit PhnI
MTIFFSYQLVSKIKLSGYIHFQKDVNLLKKNSQELQTDLFFHHHLSKID